MAFRMALNNTSSPNGFVRNSTAPAFMAWTDIGMSPCPVMKMIGMSIRSLAMRFCRSRPLRPGRETSSMRQLGTRTRGRLRNSCADANISGCQPLQRINNSSDSRTEMSSSTTNTIGVPSDMGDDRTSWPSARAKFILYAPSPARTDRLTHSKCDIERLKQSRVAEWLEQALHRTLFEHSRAHSLVSLSGDEDDWNLLPTTLQFLLKGGSGHSGHGNVEDQTSGLADAIRREELLRR